MINNKNNTSRLVISGLCLALCMVLPFLTGQIPQIGNALLPMHLPVLLCGFVCGWPYGLVVGFIAPLLRFFLFSMPPLFPIGLPMAFELAAYGALTGILYKKLPKTTGNIYLSLVISMIGGRILWGIVRYFLSGVTQSAFGIQAFFAGAFLNAIPGIILHILLIPVIVLALQKSNLMQN